MSIDIKNYLNSYEFTCDLPSDGKTITFKPFTTGQMKKLLTYENSDDPFMIEQVLDDIIDECVIDEGFDVCSLLLQDRFYLLLKIREKSKGDIYNYTYRCPDCKTDNVDSVKISGMDVKPMNIDDTPIKISGSDLSVRMKLITRGEQKNVYEVLGTSKLTPEMKMVEAMTMSVALSIKSLLAGEEEDLEVPMSDKIELINNVLPSIEFDKLQKWLSDNDYGIDFSVPVKCMACGREENFSIPVDGFFD